MLLPMLEQGRQQARAGLPAGLPHVHCLLDHWSACGPLVLAMCSRVVPTEMRERNMCSCLVMRFFSEPEKMLPCLSEVVTLPERRPHAQCRGMRERPFSAMLSSC